METKQIQHGGDEHLSMLGAPYHWNLLTGVDRADMLAFGRACMAAERKRIAAKLRSTIELDGFGCACEPQKRCNTCHARAVLSSALMPLVKNLDA